MFLILSILLNTYVGLVFSFYKKWNVSNRQAIVVNYWICVLTGCLMLGKPVFFFQEATNHLDVKAFFNGISYFLIFISIASSTVLSGITPTQIANKLSLVIPFVVSYFLYHESLGVLKIIGIVLALVAVYFAGQKADQTKLTHSKHPYLGLFLLFVIFIGSGFLDSLATYMQKNILLNNKLTNAYLILCFSGAAIAGTVYLIYLLVRGKEKLQFKNVLAGVILGVPNYFSIYSLIKALDSEILQSSALIPVNNIGVVLVSSLAAVFILKEKLNRYNYLGIALSIVAIICILVGDGIK